MKTFAVFSDSHGRRSAVEKIRGVLEESDCILCLGDGAGEMRALQREFPEKTYVVKGNCDFVGEDEIVLEEEGVKILLCHGHRYGVKGGITRLVYRAQELGCALALYGHTHRADIQTVNGVTCVNPGALSSYTEPSYCYLVIHNGKITPTIVPLKA